MQLEVLLERFVHTIVTSLELDRCLLIGSRKYVHQILAILERPKLPQVLPNIALNDYQEVAHGIVQSVVKFGASVIVPDLQQAHDFVWDPYCQTASARSIACIPVISTYETHPQILAVLYLEHQDRFNFTDERCSLLQGLCAQLAMAMAQAAECQRLLVYTQTLESQIASHCHRAGLALTDDSALKLNDMEISNIEHLPLESTRVVRLSEHKFRQLVENANDLIFSITLDGRFTYLSPKFQEMCGYEPTHFIGRSFSYLAHPEDVDSMYEHLRKQLLKRDKLTGFECRIRHKEGHYIWITSNHSAPIEDENGNLIGFQGIVRDITERKRSEQELKRTKERLQFLLSATTAVIFSLELSEHPNITYVSENIDQLVGFNADFFLNHHKAWIDRIHPEDLLTVKDTFAKTIQQCTQCSYEYRFLDHTEQYRWIYNEITLLYNEQGQPIEAVGYAADVSERRQAEAKLQLMNEQLLISNAELARATKLKDEFLANMSHELRTPLNSILGITEAMLEQPYGLLSARYQKSLRMIESSGEHLLDLINDILDLAKIEAGKLELNLGITSIKQLCQSSINFVKQLALNKGLDLNYQILVDLDQVEADDRRLRQVLINLLSNAVKFTPPGGSVELIVEGDHSSQFLLFHVKDTGIGIAAERMQQLFQPFMQIDSSLNRQYCGTGLGLALVKRIIDLHHGQIRVTSHENQGSCFTVGLPGFSPDRMPLANTTPLAPLDAPPLTHLEATPMTIQNSDQSSSPLVLLAEDNKMNIEMFTDYLDLHGYQLVIAQDGVEAVELAKGKQPHLILMDIQMPRMDGLEAIRQIRQEVSLEQVPIVALTALAMPGDAQKCLEAGANDYLSKPVKLKALVSLMKSLLPEA